jgi:hypothetical protein
LQVLGRRAVMAAMAELVRTSASRPAAKDLQVRREYFELAVKEIGAQSAPNRHE